MAKAKTLAALAGLAGLAYAYNKNKNKDDKDDKRTDARSPGDEMSSASRKMPDDDRMSNEDYIKSRMKKAPEDEKGSAQSDVLKAVTAPKTAPNDKAPNQGVVPSGKSAAAKQARPAVAKNPNYSNEGRSSTTPTAKNPDYSNEGRSSTIPTAKNPDYSNEGRSSTTPTSTPTITPVKTTTGGRVPTSEEAAANRQAAMDKVKGFGKGVVDYVSNFETPAERAARERKEASGMKRGGMVKKMASGGMTASRRGDGIASRGKTRGKIC